MPFPGTCFCHLRGTPGSGGPTARWPSPGRERGQSPFAGTNLRSVPARRVLRTNGDCPLSLRMFEPGRELAAPGSSGLEDLPPLPAGRNLDRSPLQRLVVPEQLQGADDRPVAVTGHLDKHLAAKRRGQVPPGRQPRDPHVVATPAEAHPLHAVGRRQLRGPREAAVAEHEDSPPWVARKNLPGDGHGLADVRRPARGRNAADRRAKDLGPARPAAAGPYAVARGEDRRLLVYGHLVGPAVGPLPGLVQPVRRGIGGVHAGGVVDHQHRPTRRPQRRVRQRQDQQQQNQQQQPQRGRSPPQEPRGRRRRAQHFLPEETGADRLDGCPDLPKVKHRQRHGQQCPKKGRRMMEGQGCHVIPRTARSVSSFSGNVEGSCRQGIPWPAA